MPVDPVSEEALRQALAAYRVDPQAFEAAVNERIVKQAESEPDPLEEMPPLMRAAASLMPIGILVAGRETPSAMKAAPTPGVISKLLGYAAFPAISLFLVVGSALFGAKQIRRIQGNPEPELPAKEWDAANVSSALTQWRQKYRWASWLLFAVLIVLAWIGATWLLFLAYIASTLILISVLKSFAKIGIGNRRVVGMACGVGLLLLGQLAGFAGIGDSEIHLIDPALLLPVFFLGGITVLMIAQRGIRAPYRLGRVLGLLVVAAYALTLVFWIVRPARIRAYVESFDSAEFSSVSWSQWERLASWAMETTPPVDLSRPRRLLEMEIARKEADLPTTLGIAGRVGLLQADQLRKVPNYEESRRDLLAQAATRPITLFFEEWIIRGLVARGDMTPAQRDYLAQRLHVSLRASFTGKGRNLKNLLLATQLLKAIGRPVDPNQYRNEVHQMLRDFHQTMWGGFTRAGGFKEFDLDEWWNTSSLDVTADAVQLMEVYGIPDNLDINWVRSYLKPSVLQFRTQRLVTAVARERLNRLPGIPQPSWVDWLYYERSFLAAAVLIGLCVYATTISPKPVSRKS